MKKINEIIKNITTQNLSPQERARKAYSTPYPELKHRFSYRIDIIPVNNPYKAYFTQKLPYGGHYVNGNDPIKARAVAFRQAEEVPYDPELSSYGELTTKIWFVDEQEEESRLIADLTAVELSSEICFNLEYEYELLNKLGHAIKEWELVSDPDGNPYRAIVSEFKVKEICPDILMPIDYDQSMDRIIIEENF